MEYRLVEHNGEQEKDRQVIFDLYCTSDNGSHFIIEMQQLSQDFFKDRTVYYTSRLISKLMPKGCKGNTYELPEIYFIGILDFELAKTEISKYYYNIALCDRESGELFYKKLGYKFLVLPNFQKHVSDIKTVMDMWLYLYKYMSELNEMPKFLDKRVFGLIFDIGEVANLTQTDMKAYEASLKNKSDAESIRLTALRMGRDEGLREGLAKAEAEKKAIALEFKKMGIPAADIAKGTGLSIEEIEKL